MDVTQEPQYHNCQSHKFFHGLHATHARLDLTIRLNMDGNPQVIIDNYT